MLPPTVSRPVCLGIKHLSGAHDQIFITVRELWVCFKGRSLSREDGLSFTIAAGPRQRSHSRVRVPWDSRPYFTVETSLFVSSYDSQGFGEGTHTNTKDSLNFCCCIASGWTRRKHSFHRYANNTTIVACLFVAVGTCLPRLCLAMNVYSDSTIPAFRRHVTICSSVRVCERDNEPLGSTGGDQLPALYEIHYAALRSFVCLFVYSFI
jgi:hypothetical protein